MCLTYSPLVATFLCSQMLITGIKNDRMPHGYGAAQLQHVEVDNKLTCVSKDVDATGAIFAPQEVGAQIEHIAACAASTSRRHSLVETWGVCIIDYASGR